MLVDLHCHLDLFPNYLAVKKEAEDNKVYCLCVTTAPSAYAGTKQRLESKYVKIGIGIHPEVAQERQGELGIFDQHVAGARYIGEVGLDGSARFASSMTAQIAVLNHVLRSAGAHGVKLYSIHSRGAASEVLTAIQPFFQNGPMVLHWFSGGVGELRRAIDMGCYFSVGPSMTKSKSGKAIIKLLPKNKILTETDGPFTQLSGQPMRPVHVDQALGDIADLWAAPVSEAKAQVWENFLHLLSQLPAI